MVSTGIDRRGSRAIRATSCPARGGEGGRKREKVVDVPWCRRGDAVYLCLISKSSEPSGRVDRTEQLRRGIRGGGRKEKLLFKGEEEEK